MESTQHATRTEFERTRRLAIELLQKMSFEDAHYVFIISKGHDVPEVIIEGCEYWLKHALEFAATKFDEGRRRLEN